MQKMELICSHCGKHYTSWQRGKNLCFCSSDCKKASQVIVNEAISKAKKPQPSERKPKDPKRFIKDFSIYRGDEFLFVGTALECADYLGVKVETIYFMSTPTYRKRRGGSERALMTYQLDD
jgi:hypothetical protein